MNNETQQTTDLSPKKVFYMAIIIVTISFVEILINMGKSLTLFIHLTATFGGAVLACNVKPTMTHEFIARGKEIFVCVAITILVCLFLFVNIGMDLFLLGLFLADIAIAVGVGVFFSFLNKRR